MSDFATLVLGAETSGLRKGEADLDRLTNAGERAEKQSVRLRDAKGRFVKASDKAGQSARETARHIETMSGASARAGAAIGTLATRLVAVAASGVVLGRMIGTISDFSAGMSKVAAISGATEKEMRQLRATALDLGSTTEFSATQAADALGFLSMAGFTANESLAAIPDVLDLATAGALGLGEAADIASNVLSGFGIAAAKTASVTDVLAKAASLSNTNVSQLGQAMSYVAPVAQALDVSVSQAAAAVGVLSDAGVQGTRAGTALRAIMSRLIAPTDAAVDTLEQMGLTVADVDVKALGLATVLTNLKDANIDLASATELAGVEAASNLLLLTEGTDKFRRYTAELDNAEGATKEMAKTMRDNLRGETTSLRSAVEGLILALGDAGLEAVIRAVVRVTTILVREITGLIKNIGAGLEALGSWMSGVTGAQEALEISIDNVTIAMGDQILQQQYLAGLLNDGEIMSRQMAAAKLDEAMAYIETVKGMEAQRNELELQALGYNALLAEMASYQQQLSALRTPGDDLADMPARMREQYEAIEAALANALVKQREMIAAVAETVNLTSDEAAALALAEQNAAALEAALARAGGNVVSINSEMFKGVTLTARIARSASTLSGYLNDGVRSANGLIRALSLAANAASGLARSLASAMSFLGAIGSRMSGLGSAVTNMVPALGSVGSVLKGLNIGIGNFLGSKGLAAAGKAAADAGKQLVNLFGGVKKEVEETAAAVGGGGAGKDSLTDALEKAAKEAQRYAENFTRPIAGAVDDAVSYMLNGFKDGFSGLWDIAKRTIIQIATFAIANPIKLSLGLGGAVATGAATNIASGGMTSGLIGSTLGAWGAGGAVGTGLLGGLQASLSSGIGGIFSIGANAAAAGGGIAASLGAALPAIGLLGVGIAAFVGKTKELDRGFQLTVSGMDSMVESFRTIERTRFFGLSKKVRTSVEAASADIADPITAAIAEMQGSVVDVAAQLGIASDAFSGFGASLKVSTAGMSPEEATRALQEALAGIPDQMAAMALAGHDLAREGETAFVTLQRLGSELTVVNAVLSDIGQTAYQTSLHGAGMAASLVEIMGGIDAFRAASARFYEVAYTESERLAIQVQRAEDALSSFGAAMPKSRAEYRLMVEATDLASERGRALYATLVGLADVFDQVLPAAQSLTAVISSMIGNTNGMIEQMVSEVNAVARAAERAADDWFRAADSLRDLIRDITGSRPGEEGIRALQRAMQAQFQAAKGGDVDAARAFVGTSQSYLAAARDQASTLFDARKAEASVLRQANFLAGISELEGAAKEAVVYLAEQQLGVLQELSDYLQNAETIRPEDIASFESRLGSLQAAIEQAQMFSYDYLQERLNVTVDLIPTADIPPDVAQLMEAAVAGIESSIDFAVRAQDLTPDLRWLAVTAASEHLKTIEFLIANDLPDTTRKLALMDVSLLSKTINFIIGQDISHEDKALALATSSELSRLVNVVLASGADAAAIDLALGNIASHTVTIEAKLSESSELREFVDLILGSSAGKITLGGSFQFDPSAAFSQWFSGTTAAHIVQPMTDLRASLNDLRAAVTENNHRLALQMADAVAQAQAQAVFSQRSAALENLFQTQMRTDAGDLFLDTSQVASVAGMLGLDTSQSAAVLREQIAAFSGNDSTNRVLDTTSTLQGYLWDAFRSNVVPVDPADYLTIYPDVATNSYFRTRPAEHYAGSGRDEILTGQRGFDPRAFNWNAVGIHIPGFAAGGMHAGGFRVVGENGPELEYTPPSRIYSAPQTSRMLDTTEVVNEIRALRAEVAQLRSENTYLLGELEDHAYKSRRTQESWDRIGLPPERTDA